MFFKKRRKEGIPTTDELQSDIPIFPELEEDKLPPLPKEIPEPPEFPSLEEAPEFEKRLPEWPSEEEKIPPMHPDRGAPAFEQIKRAPVEKRPLPGYMEIGPRPMATISPPPIPRPMPVERTVPLPVKAISRSKIPKHFESPGKRTEVKRVSRGFIELEQYRIILNALSSIGGSIVEAGNSLERMESLHSSSEQKQEKWRSTLDFIQKRLMDVDKRLFR